MKKILLIALFVLSCVEGYWSYIYLNGNWQFAGIFISGFGVGIFLMAIKLNIKNSAINSYKRELEKESINADESSARVKVLESKIEVLEKALDNALNK